MDAKSAQWPQKAPKNRSKTCKKLQKVAKSALAHLTNSTPSAEKTPRTLAPGPVGSKNRPKIPPKTRAKKLSTIAAVHK